MIWRRILLLAIIVITAILGANAQRLSIKTGLSLANMHAKANRNTISSHYEINHGVTLEAAVEFPIYKTFLFETGLQISTEGTKFKQDFDYWQASEEYYSDIDLYYANFPFRTKVYFSKWKLKFYGTIGAYYGIGLYGNTEHTFYLEEGNRIENTKIKWGDDEFGDNFRRIDYGLTFGGGLEYNNYIFSINYNYGLKNISPFVSGGISAYNRVIGISAGYIFQM